MGLLHPIQNGALLKQNWIQVRPRISQKFGLNPDMYKQFDMLGHNGIDHGVPVGTPVFAPMDGTVKVKDSGDAGYGLHVKIRNDFKACEIVLGHFSEVNIHDGSNVNMGDKIGLSGNSGYSSGPHTHTGFRLLKEDLVEDIFKWRVMNYDNGFKGYIDPLPYLLCWKGTHLKNSI